MGNNKNMKVDRCMARLVLSQPFYAALALRLKRVEDLSSKTAFWSDGVTLGFNSKLIEDFTDDQVMGAVCRLVEGLAHCHHTRREGRDAKMWNKASASVCTAITKQCGFELAPEDEQFYSSEWEEKSVESVYRIYEAMPKSNNGKGDDKKDGKEQGKDDSGQGAGSGQQDGQCQGQSDGSGDPDAGSGEGGGNGAGNCEIRDMQGGSAEVQDAEQEWKNATFQAARIAQAQGKCPAHAKRLCDELVTPKVDWRAVLRSFVSKLAHSKYDWNTPNRRFAWQGMYLPSRRSREVGDIVMGIDTSGSVDDELLKQFAGEVSGILEDYPTARLTVIYCDAKVHNTEVFTANDCPIKLDAHGGGGTDFRPAFKWVEENLDTPPKAMIFLTDMDGTFPEDAPDYPVIWGLIGKRTKVAPFGDIINVE